MTNEYHPEDDGPETASDLLDNHQKALKTFLREMTSVYAEDNEMVPVRFGDRAAADAQGGFVQIDPTFPDRVDVAVVGPQILRVLDDTISHEMAHINWSELESKEAFTEEYDGWGYVPGSVINILEDAYIDHRRKEKWYGLRSKMAYSVYVAMKDDEITPPVDETLSDDSVPDAQAYLDALSQLACAGYVKYESNIPPSIAEWLVDVEPILKRVRTQHDPDERWNLAHAAMALLQRQIDAPEQHGGDVIPDAIADPVPLAPDSGGGGSDDGDADDGSDPEPVGPSDPDTQEAVDEIVDAMDQADDEQVDVDRDAGEITMKTRDIKRDRFSPEVTKRVEGYVGSRDPTDLKVVND